MPRRPGLTRERVVDAAAELVDREGPSGLSLASLASRFGVRAPSLYNHVEGLEGLKRELRLRGTHALANRLSRAAVGRSQGDALRAMAGAYRGFATEHPGLYAMTLRSAAGEDEEVGRAAGVILDVIRGALRGYGLEGDDALHATRFLRSTLHGFASLEAAGGFGMPLDVSESFDRLVELLDRGLQAMSDPAARDRRT